MKKSPYRVNSLFTTIKISTNKCFIAFFFSLLYFTAIAQDNVGTLIALDVDNLQNIIKEVPERSASNASSKFMSLALPIPDGNTIEFAVKHSPLVPEDSPLYSTIASRTYSLHAIEVAGYNGSMVVYEDGIHATLNTPQGLLFIRRTDKKEVHEYVYFKDTKGFPHTPNDARRLDVLPMDDSTNEHRHALGEETHSHELPTISRSSIANNNFFKVGDQNRRILDLFVMSENDFVIALGGTTQANDRIVEVVNGVKAIWEADFNLTINYLGSYIHASRVNASTDGAGQTLFDNSVTDALVPGSNTKATVDLAHLFAGNGGGGSAALWSACGSQKADGYSGVSDPGEATYIPLVAHEMAHHLGADHTWTGQASNCTASQYGEGSGVEPGSGVSLAGYAGICGTDDVPGAGKGTYHHTESIREIVEFVNNNKRKPQKADAFFNAPPTAVNVVPPFTQTVTATCFQTTANSNNIPMANSDPNSMANTYLPTRTPFELNGSATDADGDVLTYQWDQLDFALGQQPLDGYANRTDGPLFRSYGPKSETNRIFPKLEDILSGTQIKGEKLAEVNRRMRFAFMARDGKGGVGIDTVGFNVVDNSGNGTGFAITEPINTSTPSSVALSWNVAGTNISPISCANVDILYSIDGGASFPYTLLANTANNGSATVDLSAFNTTSGRIKIKCSSSIFFDINNSNLTISGAVCSAQPNSLTSVQTIAANTGDATLDLEEANKLIAPNFYTSKQVTTSSTSGDSPLKTSASNNTCVAASFGEYHTSFSFKVSKSGSYKITGQSFVSIFQTASYTYNDTSPCGTGFITSNFDQSGNDSPLYVQVTLQENTDYVAVVSSQNASEAFSVTFEGPGSGFESQSPATGTAYTYIAVNTANDMITKVDANADFKSLGSGTYKVYGVSYATTITPSSWANMTSAAVFMASTCAIKSANHHTLTVTGTGGGSNPGFGEAGCGGTANFTILDANIPSTNGIFKTNGTITTSGTVDVSAGDGNIAFRAGTSITLTSGFHAQAGSSFLAIIESCATLQEEPSEEVAFAVPVNRVTTNLSDLAIVPNPTTNETTFQFHLEEAALVNIAVYSTSGQLLNQVVQNKKLDQGIQQIPFQAAQLKGGMFYVILRTGKEIQTKKMVVINN